MGKFKLKRFKLAVKNFSIVSLLVFVFLGALPPEAFAAATTIRQEINILAGETLSGTGTVESKARIYLDTTKYTSATYYFEAVYNGAASNTGTIKLSRAGTSTYDASLTGSTSATYALSRSASFSPPAGQTEYTVTLVGDASRTQTVKSARIIIIQNSNPLTATQTQIEIGNAETGKSNTSDAALTYPKYWKYDSANWDGTVTFYAEATYKYNSVSEVTETFDTAGASTWQAPTGVSSVAVQVWGGGGAGGGGTNTGTPGGSGGGGGGYASETITVTPGNTYNYTVGTGGTGSTGTGGAGGTSIFTGDASNSVQATGGNGGAINGGAAGTGGTGSGGTVSYTGGTGAVATGTNGGGGGEGANTTSNGANGSGITGGSSGNGGNGANGAAVGANGNCAFPPGGGGGGSGRRSGGSESGGCGYLGQVSLTYTPVYTVTVKLQESDGSGDGFTGWADKVTIVNAASATSATRVRSSSFTPTSGRNYRIVSSINNASGTYDIYNAKIVINQNFPVDDSYDESNRNGDVGLNSNSNTAVGQSFTSTGGILDSVSFFLSKTGSPTGNAVAKIYAHSGTYGTSSVPTGAALATSDNFNVAGLDNSSRDATFLFTGANRISLVNGTRYFVSIEYSGGDANNKPNPGADSSSPTHNGNYAQYFGGSWGALSTYDLIFRVNISSGSEITKLEPQYLLANTVMGVVDSYSESYIDTYHAMSTSGGNTAAYQSFAVEQAVSVNKVTFFVRRVGTLSAPTTATATIQAHTGTYGTSSLPTGGILGTSGTRDLAGISTVFYQPITFTFSTPVSLSANTKYVVGFNFSGGSGGVNYIQLGSDGTGSSHAGNASAFPWTGPLTLEATVDIPFYMYGTRLENALTTWNSAEWSGVSNTYFHAVDAGDGSASVAELDTAAGSQLSGSEVTFPDNQGISGSVTMPANGNIDAKVTTNDADLYGSRILVQVRPPTVTVTLGDGTDPGSPSTIGPGGSATEIDRFSLVTNQDTDTINNMTVTLAGHANAYQNIATVAVYTTDDVLACSATPSANAVNLTSCGISVTTTPTEYKILITPKTHANMPAVPGASYDTTATVTSITATNAYSGTDTDSATITVDNGSPNNATSTSGTAGVQKVTLAWTASSSADISSSVILRWAASTPGSEVPVEGTTYTANQTISTATIACVISSTASQSHSSIVDGSGGTAGCNTSALSAQDYSYKVFQLDSRGNYDAGVTFTGSPFTPTEPIIAISGTSSGLDGAIARVAINGVLNASTFTIASNAWSISPTANPSAGHSVIVFVTDGDGDIADNLEATAVSVYDGSGDMTGMSLVPGTLSIGSANSQSVSITEIGEYTCSSDEDVMYSVSANVLNLQGCSNSYTDETLSTLATNTLTVATSETVTTEKINNAGTITATGSPTFNVDGTSGTLFTNSGTFNQATSTVNLRGNGNATINSGSPTFYYLTSSGTGTKTLGAGITFDTNGGLDVTAGVFDPSTYAITTGPSNWVNIRSGATIIVNTSTLGANYGGATQINPLTGSTVTFKHDGNTTIYDYDFYNLEISPTITDNRIYTLSPLDLVLGNLTVNPTAGSALNLLVNMGAGLTVTGDTTITRTNSATSTLDPKPAGSEYNFATSHLTINTGGTFDATSSTANIDLTGTSGTLITMGGGTFTAGGSTTRLLGNGNVTINSGSPTFNRLLIDSSGTKTLGANITIGTASNDFIVTTATFDPAGYVVNGSFVLTPYTNSTIKVTGENFTDTYAGLAGVSTGDNNATIEYSRSGNQTIGNALTIEAAMVNVHLATSGSGIKTMSVNRTGKSMTVGSGTTLALSDKTLTLSGTSGTLFTNSGSIDDGTSTVKFTPDGAVTLFSGSFTGGNSLYNLELSPALGASRTYTGGAAVTVANDFNILPTGGSSRVLTYNLGGTNTITDTLTIAPAATSTSATVSTTGSDHALNAGYIVNSFGGTLTANSSTISLTGTTGTLFTNHGTFTPGSSTLDLSGNGDANINTLTPLTVNNLTISSTGTKKAVGALTLNGTLNVSNANGAFYNGGQNLSVTGNITNSGTLTVSPVSPNWEYYRTITIDKTKVPSTQTDFPVLVSGTYTYLKTTGNGGKVRHASGYDVAFFADPALTQPLKFERETWEATTGVVEYWVKVPAVSHLVDTVIYMAYGNTSITSDLSDSANTWSNNFAAVYHYGDGTTISSDDSLGVNNATIVNDVTATTGKVGGAAQFGGSDDYINNGGDSSLETQTLTWSAWVYPTGSTTRDIFGNSANNNPQFIIGGDNSLYFNSQGSATLHNTGIGAISNDAWNHLAIWSDGTNYGMYINGLYASTVRTVTFAYGGDIYIGTESGLVGEFTGKIDEARFSSIARNEDWLDTEYNNQNNPATFYTVGDEATPSSPTVTVTGTVTNSGTFNAGVTDGDATAFLRATGITNPVISKAVGDLVNSAKLHGWWDKADAIYPFVGGTADTHKYNLKDPRDVDAAYRLTFNGGWTHDATGADPNGTTGYAQTHLIPSSVLSTNNLHVSYYSEQTGASSATSYEVGAMNNSSQELGLILRRSNDGYYSIMHDEGSSLITGTHTDGEGFFMGSRTSSTSHNLYKDGTSIASNNTAQAGSLPTYEIYLAGLNLTGGLYGPSDKKVTFATIGDGINSTLAQRMYLDIEKFRDTVDRSDSDTLITGPVISIAGTGTAWNNTGNIIPGTSVIKLTDTSASAKTFAGGGDTYNNLWLAGGTGGGSYTITGNNTFNDFKDDGTVTHSIAFASDSTQTLNSFTVSGANASNRITITSTDTNNHNLVKTGTKDIESDFLVVEKSVATPSGDWYAGTSSVNNNSAGSGWRFNTPGAARGGGAGNAGGEGSGGGTPVGGGTGTGGGGGGAGGEGSGGGQGQTGGEGTCSDGIQNGNETGIDTGGRCSTGGGGGDTGYLHKSNLLAYAGGVDVIQILRLIFRF